MDSKIIPLSVPNLSIDILENIKETIETGWVSTGGRFIQDFEEKIARYVKVDKAISCQSGTAGLHLALRALGIGSGDDSLNMDVDKLEYFLTNHCSYVSGNVVNKATNKIIKAILVVHVFGNPANMERLVDIKERFNLKLIEDATEALGSYYLQGRYAGKYCGTIGDIGVYSFNANKIITTGGGGIVVSKNQNLLERVSFLGVQAKTDPLYFIHDEIGYNYRMTNIQAAFGTDQIDRLEGFIEAKIQNYNTYKEAIAKVAGLSLLPFRLDSRANHWFYSVIVNKDRYGMSRDELLKKLNEKNIQTRPLWGLIHKQKPYLINQEFDIQNAYYYEANLINIPCSSNLTQSDIEQVIGELRKHECM